MATDAIKHDSGKAPLSLVDRKALVEIAKVLKFGATKYAPHNWREGFDYSRLIDAALRHLYAFADGEDLDEETGLSHLAHAGCCVIFLLGNILAGKGKDDRHTALRIRKASENIATVESKVIEINTARRATEVSPRHPIGYLQRYGKNVYTYEAVRYHRFSWCSPENGCICD